MSNLEPPILIVDCGTISALPVIIYDNQILSTHVVVGYDASNKYGIVGDWTVTTANGSLTISGDAIAAPVSLKVYLSLPHHIYIDDSGHGTAIASPENAVITDTVSLTPVPDARYRFVEWESDPDVIFTDNTFLMPGTNVEITPVFERYIFDVLISESSRGTASSIPEYAEAGEMISLISVPNEHFRFLRWESNPVVVFTDNTFVMPGSDITITPIFEFYAGYYDGTYFLPSVPMYYDGTNWIECEWKYYDGANWANADST